MRRRTILTLHHSRTDEICSLADYRRPLRPLIVDFGHITHFLFHRIMIQKSSNSLSNQERSYRYDIDVILENYMPHPNTPTTSTTHKKQNRSHPRHPHPSSGTSTSKSRPHTPPPAEFYMRPGASPPSGSRKTSQGHSRGGSTSQVPSLSSVSAILSPRPMSAIDRSKMQEIAAANRGEQGSRKGNMAKDAVSGQPSASASDKRTSAGPPLTKTKSSGTSSHSTRAAAHGDGRRQHSASSANDKHGRSEPSSADEDDETIHGRLPIVEEI